MAAEKGKNYSAGRRKGKKDRGKNSSQNHQGGEGRGKREGREGGDFHGKTGEG